MGGFGFIPPQQIQVGGPTGTNQGPNASMMQPNQAGQVALAAGQLLQGAANMKQAQQAHYKQKYDDAVQGIATGTLINPDYTEIMKWGQKAGLPMKADVTPADVAAHSKTAQDAAYAQQQQAQQASQVESGLPGNPAMAQMASMAQTNLPPGVSPPPSAAPGFMSRLGQGVNHMFGGNAGRPPVSMDSPMGQFLQSVSKASQGNGVVEQLARANEDANLQHHLTMATKKLGLQDTKNGMQLTGEIFQKMLQGDPNSTEILFKTGHIKDMPIDTLEGAISRAEPNSSLSEVRAKAGQIMLFMQTDGPKLRAQMGDLTKELLPHFDSNPAKVMAFLQDPTDPNNQPHMSVEESKQYSDSMKTILDNRIGVPVQLVGQYASAKLSGKNDLADSILKTIDLHYPAANAVEAADKKTGRNLEAGRLQNDIVNTQGTLFLRGKEADTGRFAELRKGLEQLNALPKDMVENPKNYDEQQFLDAANLVSSNNNSVAKLLKDYGASAPITQTRPTSGKLWGTGKNPVSIQGTPPPDNWMAGMLGTKPTTPTTPDDERVQALKQQLLRIPKADRARVISTTAMPEAVRKALKDWDPDAEDKQQAVGAVKGMLQDIGK